MDRKKSLLFHQGKKASPGQIKPLTSEESERYMQPFKQGIIFFYYSHFINVQLTAIKGSNSY